MLSYLCTVCATDGEQTWVASRCTSAASMRTGRRDYLSIIRADGKVCSRGSRRQQARAAEPEQAECAAIAAEALAKLLMLYACVGHQGSAPLLEMADATQVLLCYDALSGDTAGT